MDGWMDGWMDSPRFYHQPPTPKILGICPPFLPYPLRLPSRVLYVPCSVLPSNAKYFPFASQEHGTDFDDIHDAK